MPATFIANAEDSGLITAIDEWVLHTACEQARAWQDDHLDLQVAINLSPRQFMRPDIGALARRILDQCRLSPVALILEITESVLVHDLGRAIANMRALRLIGVQLAIDDFGKGFSSLNYLKHFPVDQIKIDRSFIREIAIHPDDAAITTAIIAMGHALGLRVIAEGVETEAHLTLLQKQGCDEVQGYLVGRPVPADRFVDHLARKRSGGSSVRRQRSTR
jgi:EAL domain-containing protein (putative c-di-GMP-specific phosphodiesterase class I)